MRISIRNLMDDRRRDLTETQKYVINITNSIKGQLEDDAHIVHNEINGLKGELDSIAGFRLSLQQLLEPKADINEVQQAITESQTLVARRITELREELFDNMKLLKEEIDKKASVSYVSSAMGNRAEQSMFNSAIQDKVSISDFNQVISKLESLQSELDQKIDRSDFEQHTVDERDQLNGIRKELLLKSSIKDVCTLVDIKANSEDVKRAFGEVHTELEKRIPASDFSAAMTDQSLINEALCAENCVGRWLWKSGSLKNGFAVPWEAQSVNRSEERRVGKE